MRLVAQRDSNAVVGDIDNDGSRLAISLNADSSSRFVAMLQSIIEKIIQRLVDSKCIGLNSWQIIRDSRGDNRAAFANSRIQLLKNAMNAFREIDRPQNGD